MSRYLVHSKHPKFSGRLCGVRFKDGRAIVDEYTIDASLGWTVEEIVKQMQGEFQCTVAPIGADVVVEELEGDTPAPKPNKSHKKKAGDKLPTKIFDPVENP